MCGWLRWYWFGESQKLDDSHDKHKYDLRHIIVLIGNLD
jgi:hypothetical protein